MLLAAQLLPQRPAQLQLLNMGSEGRECLACGAAAFSDHAEAHAAALMLFIKLVMKSKRNPLARPLG